MTETIVTAIFFAIVTALYFTLGIGVARAIKRIEFPIIICWPVVLALFATRGEIG